MSGPGTHQHAPHNHTHHGHSHGRHEDSAALRTAMIMTGVIFVAQVIGGYVANSLALLSDAGHMLTDFAALLISFVALRLAARPESAIPSRYTFGLRRAEILAALVNGLFLLAICLYIGVESIERFFSPQPVQTVPMLIVASIGLLANLVSAWILHGSENMNTRSAYLHVMADLFSSVGVVIGGVIIHYSGLYWVDPLLSLLIAAVIVRSAYRLVREASSILMESAPRHIDVDAVAAELCRLEGVRAVHDVHVWQLRPGEVAMSVHVVLNGTADNYDQRLSAIRALLLDSFGVAHSTVQLESAGFSAREDCRHCPW